MKSSPWRKGVTSKIQFLGTKMIIAALSSYCKTLAVACAHVIILILCFFVFVCPQVILTEVYPVGFRRSFFDEEDLTSIAENDVIYAFQAPPLYIRGGSARISGNHLKLSCHVGF